MLFWCCANWILPAWPSDVRVCPKTFWGTFFFLDLNLCSWTSSASRACRLLSMRSLGLEWSAEGDTKELVLWNRSRWAWTSHFLRATMTTLGESETVARSCVLEVHVCAFHNVSTTVILVTSIMEYIWNIKNQGIWVWKRHLTKCVT